MNKNYNKLPDMCWGVLALDNTIIIIKKGQSGYYKTDYPAAESREAAEEWCDELNERIGVAKNVRRAMEHGSMFGWDTPSADPEDKINFLTYNNTDKNNNIKEDTNMSNIKTTILTEELNKKEQAERERLEKLFAETKQKDMADTIKELSNTKGKVITFPNGLVAFVGGTNDEDITKGVAFVEEYAASHKDNPRDILTAQAHIEADLSPTKEVKVCGRRFLYYQNTQNLRDFDGHEIADLNDIPGKEYIPVEAAIELLTRRAEEKIDDYEEDEEWEDEE